MLSPEEQDRLLRYNVLLSRKSDAPLHAQLTRSLRLLVLRHFEVGEKFYTEEELAEKLALSVGTIRRSLNRLVDEGLLERYRGQGTFVLRASREQSEGLQIITLVNTFDSFCNNMFLRELSYQCLKRGHTLEVRNPGQDMRASRAFEPDLFEKNHTRFIFLALEPQFTADLNRTMLRHNIPAVSIDTWLSGYPGIQIGVDNRRGIEVGLDHLRELGHRRVALVLSEWIGSENIRERAEAFESYIEAYGLDGCVIESSPLPEFPELADELHLPTGERYAHIIDDAAARRVIEAGVTAAFCVSDIGACYLMKHLQQAGKSVPADFSVIGFNDEGTGLMVYPELTTIALPYAASAETAIGCLERADGATRHQRIEPGLVIRASTGPAPA
jgi:LacI family transcriptional regulator